MHFALPNSDSSGSYSIFGTVLFILPDVVSFSLYWFKIFIFIHQSR